MEFWRRGPISHWHRGLAHLMFNRLTFKGHYTLPSSSLRHADMRTVRFHVHGFEADDVFVCARLPTGMWVLRARRPAGGWGSARAWRTLCSTSSRPPWGAARLTARYHRCCTCSYRTLKDTSARAALSETTHADAVIEFCDRVVECMCVRVRVCIVCYHRKTQILEVMLCSVNMFNGCFIICINLH